MQKVINILYCDGHGHMSQHPLQPHSSAKQFWGQSLTFVTCLLGVAYKNLAMKSDSSQMRPNRSGFDYEQI